MKSPFKEWKENNGVSGVSYTLVGSGGKAEVDAEMFMAVVAMEEGRCKPYKDTIKEEFEVLFGIDILDKEVRNE